MQTYLAFAISRSNPEMVIFLAWMFVDLMLIHQALSKSISTASVSENVCAHIFSRFVGWSSERVVRRYAGNSPKEFAKVSTPSVKGHQYSTPLEFLISWGVLVDILSTTVAISANVDTGDTRNAFLNVPDWNGLSHSSNESPKMLQHMFNSYFSFCVRVLSCSLLCKPSRKKSIKLWHFFVTKVTIRRKFGMSYQYKRKFCTLMQHCTSLRP